MTGFKQMAWMLGAAAVLNCGAVAAQEYPMRPVRLVVPFAAGSPGSFARAVRRRSGIADFHPHRCRHAFATRWLVAGGSLPVLQELLGHRDLATTMRYARVSEDLVLREAARVRRRQARRA